MSKSTFSESGLIAYQIRGNEASNSMLVKQTVCPYAHPDLLGWVKKSDIEIVYISIF